MNRPTHLYIGRLPCGCCMASCYDLEDADTRKSVNDFMKSGLAINRITFDENRLVAKEPGYMNCHHGQTSLL